MVATAQEAVPRGTGLAPAFAAARARLGLVALLFALAGVGWWWTANEMRGMDAGPWTSLGTLGWFLGVWVVMMAAMMFPSVAPTVALYSQMTKARSLVLPLLFAAGYLVTWAAAGALAFSIAIGGSHAAGDVLSWDRAGRWIAGAVLVVAAVYELTPLKDACLGKCRSPLGFLLGAWRDGRRGAMEMGAKHGAWCVGCCWGLMAALFALGVMSIGWMAFIAALIAIEKLLPWKAVANLSIAALLVVLGLGVAFFADDVPGLTLPDSPEAMAAMDRMGMGGGSMNDSQMQDQMPSQAKPMEDQGQPMKGNDASMQGKMPTREKPMPQGGSMGMK